MNTTVDLLRRALNPHSVAVIGASADPSKFGGRVMNFLVKHGYTGRIIAVNPGTREVLGIQAVSSILTAASAADIALLAVPPAHIASALDECGRAGVPCAVIITADFAEIGAKGAARQEELLRIARQYGMRLIGPNCLGFINPHLNLALTSSVALAVSPMPCGDIGLISQSGSLMATVISHAHDLGAGISIAASIGNQADLDVCDFLEYMIDDARTRAICVYVEGLHDGRRFLTLANRARAAGKPLLVVKAGRSAAGQTITQSHTASIAGSHQVWEAACRDHAVCLLDDPETMLQCAYLLARFGAPPSESAAVMSPSGGTLAVTSDRLADASIALSPLEEPTKRGLAAFLPPSRPLNPLDMGGLPREQTLEASIRAYDLVARDRDVGIVLIVVATTPQLEEKVKRWGTAALANGKPTVILLAPGSLVDGARAELRRIGCPYVNRMDDALKIMRAAIRYGAALRMPADHPTTVVKPELRLLASGLPGGNLLETEAKQLLRVCGIPATQDIIVASENEAVEAAKQTGHPVVMKAACRQIVHKSDIGAVKLNLTDDPAVRNAWHTISENIKRAFPAAETGQCVIQPMISGGTEMILGTRWDSQFGAVVIAGAGGILVELLNDTVTALAPISPERAMKLLRQLRMWPMLTGVRGKPLADVEALAQRFASLSELAAALGPALAELDINPLLVRDAGQGVIALDARAVLHPEKLLAQEPI